MTQTKAQIYADLFVGLTRSFFISPKAKKKSAVICALVCVICVP